MMINLLQVSRHLIRLAEAYVEGKSGYWQFIFEIQEEVYAMLLEQHYKPFLIRLGEGMARDIEEK